MQTYGPRRITQVRQVSIPARLMAAVGLYKHSEVYLELTESEPTRLVIIPASEVDEATEKVLG